MSRRILLFIPGYYGSTLKEEKTGVVRWAKASNFLFSKTGISCEIPGTQIGSPNKLIVDGILKNVRVIPKLWDVESYRSTLKQLNTFANESKMELETVSYDWRDDFVNCLQVIDQKIKSFNLTAQDELFVVAHSMGGLLMSYYLRYGAQDVDVAKENWDGLRYVTKAALVAPPLHGLMILFRDIEDGTSLGVNRSLLSGRDYSTFKSSYFFLPPRLEDIGLKENGEKTLLEIHNVDNWQKNHWGPFKYAKPSEFPKVRDFVQKYMSRSEKFHSLLRAPVLHLPEKKMPLLHLRGLGFKTKELATIRTENNRIRYSFLKSGEVNGDGTVTEISGVPLAYFKELNFTGIDLGLGHLDVLSTSEPQKIIRDFLQT